MILKPYPEINNQREAIRIGTNQLESYNRCFPSACNSYVKYIGTTKNIPTIKKMTEYSYNNVVYGIAHSNLIDELRKTKPEYKSKTNQQIIDSLIYTKNEKYFTDLLIKKYDSDRYLWDIHQEAINALIKDSGLKVERVIATDKEIKEQLDKGFPVVAGFDIRKPLGRTVRMGHIVLVTGYDTAGYTIGDSFGDPNSKYRDYDGFQVHVSLKELYDLFPKGSYMFRTVAK